MGERPRPRRRLRGPDGRRRQRTLRPGRLPDGQLHGHETPDVCAAVTVPVIKAIPVTHDASAEQIRALAAHYLGIVDFLLLDTATTSLFGGSGESFNWRVARDLASAADLFLAGGIGPENVAEAIATMRPYAVDLSSSVESSPGVKDLDRLAAFFDAVRATETT